MCNTFTVLANTAKEGGECLQKSAVHHAGYTCLFLDEKQGMRNLKTRNFSRGKQTRKTRKCKTKNQAFWKLLEEEMIENSKYFFPIQPSQP